jgi:hypothetical protein
MAKKRLELALYGLRKTLERAITGDAGELSMLREDAVAVASVSIVLDPASCEAVSMLRLATRAGRAMWALVNGHGAPVAVPLDGETPIHLQGTIDESLVSGSNWLDCFWLAALMRDAAARDVLLNTVIDFDASSTQTQTFKRLLIDALRAYARGSDAVTPARAALEAVPLDDEWVRAIDRPQIALAVHIFARDPVKADVALYDAFQEHRRYWERADRADFGQGWLSVPLAALIVIARDLGLRVETTSDYAPSQMIDGCARG